MYANVTGLINQFCSLNPCTSDNSILNDFQIIKKFILLSHCLLGSVINILS